MGLFDKLLGGAKKPDDYVRASKIASTIDAFVSTQGLSEQLKSGWLIELRKDYGISLKRGRGDGALASVQLDDLEEMADYKRIMSDDLMGSSPLGHMTTDRLAMAVLRKIKEQLGG